MTALWTSRYENPALAGYVKLGFHAVPITRMNVIRTTMTTSRSSAQSAVQPRFPVRYPLTDAVRRLAPSHRELHLPEQEFVEAFTARLDRHGPDAIRERLDGIAGPDARLVLLCFEDVRTGALCHRRVFAEWWEQHTGQWVPELPHPKPDAEGRNVVGGEDAPKVLFHGTRDHLLPAIGREGLRPHQPSGRSGEPKAVYLTASVYQAFVHAESADSFLVVDVRGLPLFSLSYYTGFDTIPATRLSPLRQHTDLVRALSEEIGWTMKELLDECWSP